MDPGKKISFGFSKQSKKPALLRQPSPPKVELVECLEGHAVKVKDAVEEVHEPLVIPIKEDRKGIVDRIKQARAKQSSEANTKDELEGKPDSELTLDELAARELLNDAKKKLEQENDPEGKVLVLPTKEDKLKLEGEPEPTLEDYENIPISDYGLAMLRGMGWKEGTGIGKKPVKTNLAKPPDVRPKGLGLGATRVIQEEKSKDKAVDKDGKELILKKGAFAKIIAGPNKGSYCKVLGLDDEAARVIVKTALKETVLSLNEFMVVLVSEEEYNRNSKVLNHAKYEEHKERINNDLIKKEPDSISFEL
ncbi:unnamed protein product [Acanthoscelides obtectus]|uniref:G-patch domain-containing protein n=1 Tax=Acanthoscelides obtectus TaxID=200917 RepID=A0A9P0P9D9_ACAOB|nr:unnamed protein product [Acanthoscelides obtectus]CAK1626343.1 G-patch domain and KOW motifs-containing protein homolog 1 [Acanthoscelides obtectus]